MNNMPSKKSIISLALGSVFAATLGTVPVASAGESPFTTQALTKGYMVAESHYGEKKEGYGGMKDQDRKYGEGRCGMSMADTDKDGRVSKEEHARHSQMMFEKMDANKDGYIDKDEANMIRKKHGYGHGQRSGERSGERYGSKSGDRDYHDYHDRHGYNERSGKPGYEQRAGIGDEHYQYGTRATDRYLQHMKPMGE
ncbi:MAG: hypothetical protein L0H15_08500 [Nitrosospira sp.]|nr:hypothetical protein [Nitrosospira sp.]